MRTVGERIESEDLEDDLQRLLRLARAVPSTSSRFRHSRREKKSTTFTDSYFKGCTALNALRTKNSSRKISLAERAFLDRNSKGENIAPAEEKSEASSSDESFTNEKNSASSCINKREKYHSHFNGLQGYGTTGLSLLEDLINSAICARNQACSLLKVRFGAAVLSSENKIFTGCNIEATDSSLNMCAERVALVKLSCDSPSNTVEAMVICSDIETMLPFPCGLCRQYMTDFGDFLVYILKSDLSYESTTSYALFPKPFHSTFSDIVGQQSNNEKEPISVLSKGPNRSSCYDIAVSKWSSDDVIDWLSESVKLPEYSQNFAKNAIDGNTLFCLEDCDLQQFLSIHHPLHRRKILIHIDRLKDKELIENGINYGQLQDYLSILDKDRIELISKLKESFDRLDENKDGKLEFKEVQQAFELMGYNMKANETQNWINQRDINGDGQVNFQEFVMACSEVGITQGCRSGSGSGIGTTESKSNKFVNLAKIRKTFDRMDTNKNGSIDVNELSKAFSLLGKSNTREKVCQWLEEADIDKSGCFSFAEFVLRYLQLERYEISNLKEAFESFEPVEDGSFRPLSIVSVAFRQLKANFDSAKVDAWCANYEANNKPFLNFAEFVLAFFTFCQSTPPDNSDLSTRRGKHPGFVHRERIYQLQQSGHVRISHRKNYNVATSDEEKTASEVENDSSGYRKKTRLMKFMSKKKIYSEEKEQDSSSEDQNYNSLKMRRVRKIFQRFSLGFGQVLTAPEATQALTELNIFLSREKIIEYWKERNFTSGRVIELGDFEKAFLRMQKRSKLLSLNEPQSRSRVKRREYDRKINEMNKLLSGKYGRHHNRKDYDEFLRKNINFHSPNYSCSDDTRGNKNFGRNKSFKKKIWRKEIHTIQRKRNGKKQRTKVKHRYCSSDTSSDTSTNSSSNSSSFHKNRHIVRRHNTKYHCSDNESTTSELTSSAFKYRRFTPKRKSDPYFHIGDLVKWKDPSTGKFCIGTIVKISDDKRFGELRLYDGRRVKNIELRNIKKATFKRETNSKLKKIAIGDVVAINQHERTREGTVVNIHKNGKLDIKLNNGNILLSIGRDVLSTHTSIGNKNKYTLGTKVKVETILKGNKRIYKYGRIKKVFKDGQYDIAYENNEIGYDVPESKVILIRSRKPLSDNSDSQYSSDLSSSLYSNSMNKRKGYNSSNYEEESDYSTDYSNDR